MFSITELIGRNSQAIERIIGRAQSSELVTNREISGWTKSYYQQKSILIFYIDNVADWIIVHKIDNNTIEEFIAFLNLRIAQTNLQHFGIVKYYNICGLREVAIFGDNIGRIQMISIKAFTE
ncbi:hypothetical protein Q0590_26545 [Rhodocytophaga aerolata]|uniref:Uncharacterized protein n=1 Tax=Rhodocytophaga aerolata TaxID=455078 RepID=A0ABT8RCN4_9BACT|nr:hypothetical protein [Rhodocytophaga aerolata]MDO1449867.1 hypothetical protein [Rhodocytophaga aerolata]